MNPPFEVIRTVLAATVIGSLDREITREIMAALEREGWAIVPSDWAKEASANDNA